MCDSVMAADEKSSYDKDDRTRVSTTGLNVIDRRVDSGQTILRVCILCPPRGQSYSVTPSFYRGLTR